MCVGKQPCLNDFEYTMILRSAWKYEICGFGLRENKAQRQNCGLREGLGVSVYESTTKSSKSTMVSHTSLKCLEKRYILSEN